MFSCTSMVANVQKASGVWKQRGATCHLYDAHPGATQARAGWVACKLRACRLPCRYSELSACRQCMVPALHALALATGAAVASIRGGGHVAPSLAEEIQDSVAAIYGLLQLKPALDVQHAASKAAVCAVADAMLGLIQVQPFCVDH